MNKSSSFKTFHELGNFLIELGEQLKKNQNGKLEYVINIEQINKRNILSDDDISDNMKKFACRIENMNRDETKTELLTLKYKELIKLSEILSIYTGGIKKKEEIMNRILYSLFDTMEGHRLIRNFSQNSD